MNYLWDTDTCIYFLNGVESVVGKTKLHGKEKICITILSIAELKYGCYKSTKVKQNLQRVIELQSALNILSEINDNDTTQFGKIKTNLQKQGIVIGDIDLLIGCIALTRNLTLVTNNKKHYQHLPDLKIENWFSITIS